MKEYTPRGKRLNQSEKSSERGSVPRSRSAEYYAGDAKRAGFGRGMLAR